MPGAAPKVAIELNLGVAAMGIRNEATAARAAQRLEDDAETLANGTEKFLETTAKYIAAHPLQSLGLAVAAGYLLSRLTR